MTKVLVLILMVQLLMTNGICTANQGQAHIPAGNQVATPQILDYLAQTMSIGGSMSPYDWVTAISKMDGSAAVPPPSWTWSPCYECDLMAQ